MSTNEYPVFFQSQLLGTTPKLIYTVPAGKTLQDLQLKITNTDSTGITTTVYCVQDIAESQLTNYHDGADDAAVLTDSIQSWEVDQWVGYKIINNTDGSEGIITANTATTITATLSGGTGDDWDIGDEYSIYHTPSPVNAIYPSRSVPANDYDLVPVERANAGSGIYASASTALLVNIQAIGGKLHSL